MQLKGCLNDVIAHQVLLEACYGLKASPDCLRVLTDMTEAKPTADEIRKGMDWLVAGARSGDVLIFHYSGLGSKVFFPFPLVL